MAHYLVFNPMKFIKTNWIAIFMTALCLPFMIYAYTQNNWEKIADMFALLLWVYLYQFTYNKYRSLQVEYINSLKDNCTLLQENIDLMKHLLSQASEKK